MLANTVRRHDTRALQNDIRQEGMSCSSGLECQCEFGDFGWRVCEVANELPVGRCKEEDEDNVDEEEEEVW